LISIASVSSARADVLDEPPLPLEVGVYTGTFISNYYHQYYDQSKFPGAEGQPDYRPELRRFSPLLGARFAAFVLPWLGVEVDLNMVMAETKESADHPRREAANIFSARAQLMFQAANLSSVVVPYVSIGDGFGRLSSDYLGSDTDFPPFLGAGARFLVNRSITLRIDGRWMRAPTPHEPQMLNCNLGELMFGISYRPSRAPAPPPPPPPKDSDGDGILDDVDRCPLEPEDKDGYDDSDGCLDLDNDGDALIDANDKCPIEPEDKDGFQDDDGCVDQDNDSDGLVDLQDKCINDAEDVDGFKDTDGCPDPDNDNDGFADAQDKCPLESEIINGVDDEDGCPDKGNALVVLSPDRLETLENIEFKKATLQAKSANVLGQLGATLRAHPEILRLRITVHMQPTKNPDEDRQVSELRAQAIREWLITYGIDEKRIEPRGFGSTKPLVDPTTKGAKGINERIDLIILERK
jgi:outer membrane protein OmpA-like peptidoglycan-associated protein